MSVRTQRPSLRALPALLLALSSLVLVGPLTLGAHASSRVWGVDVASYQHPNGAGINWRSVRSAGASFAMVKATEGTTYTNPYFAGDWAGIRGAGLVRAAYAFARPALPYSTAADQARTFVSVVGTTDESGDLPPMLDLEATGGLTPSQLATWTRTWLQTMSALTGRTPMIYVGQYFWRDQVGNAGGFSSYPWWLPAYSSAAPRAPYAGGWPAWTMWQYTSSAAVPGIAGQVDASNFSGSPGQLAALADGRNTLIAARYAQLRGLLGNATGPTVPISGGFAQAYAHGAIVELSGAVHAVWGSTGERYLAERAWRGGLGVPTTDTTSVGGGSLASFTGGTVTAQRGRPVYVVSGAVDRRWRSAGGLRTLGWPTGQGLAVGHPSAAGDVAPVTGGIEQSFEHGNVYSSTKSGSHVVTGPILALYDTLDGPAGALGMPASDAYPGALGQQVDFQVGSIAYVSALRRAVVL